MAGEARWAAGDACPCRRPIGVKGCDHERLHASTAFIPERELGGRAGHPLLGAEDHRSKSLLEPAVEIGRLDAILGEAALCNLGTGEA